VFWQPQVVLSKDYTMTQSNLSMSLMIAGPQVSGSLAADLSYALPDGVYLNSSSILLASVSANDSALGLPGTDAVAATPVAVAGSIAPDGAVNGVFDGYMTGMSFTPGQLWVACYRTPAHHFTWSLAPR
jgi:hypothetical protein